MVDGGLSINVRGTTLASGAASVSGALPTVSGIVPNYCRISATVAAYVAVGVAGVTAAAGDMMIQPGDAAVIRTQSLTNFAVLQVSGPGVVQVSPIDQL